MQSLLGSSLISPHLYVIYILVPHVVNPSKHFHYIVDYETEIVLLISTHEMQLNKFHPVS